MKCHSRRSRHISWFTDVSVELIDQSRSCQHLVFPDSPLSSAVACTNYHLPSWSSSPRCCHPHSQKRREIKKPQFLHSPALIRKGHFVRAIPGLLHGTKVVGHYCNQTLSFLHSFRCELPIASIQTTRLTNLVTPFSKTFSSQSHILVIMVGCDLCFPDHSSGPL